MKIEHIEPVFEDARGRITDILEDEPIEYVTVITSLAGTVRGNHVHRETHQWLYVLAGSFRYVTELPDGTIQDATLRAGDLLLTEPMEKHALEMLEDVTMLVLTRGPRGGRRYEDDTIRLEEPLIRAGR